MLVVFSSVRYRFCIVSVSGLYRVSVSPVYRVSVSTRRQFCVALVSVSVAAAGCCCCLVGSAAVISAVGGAAAWKKISRLVCSATPKDFVFSYGLAYRLTRKNEVDRFT